MLRYYRLELLKPDGNTIVNDIAIDNLKKLNTFLKNIGLGKNHIIKTSSAYAFKNHYLKLEQQLLLLIQVRALMLNENINIGNVFVNWFKSNKKLAFLINYMQQNQISLDLFFEALGFLPIVIETIKSAKDISYAKQLDYAIIAITDEIELVDKTKGIVEGNIFKVLFSLSALLLLPALVALTSSQYSNPNGLITFLVKTNNYYPEILLTLLVFLGVSYYFRDMIIHSNLIFLRLINKIISTKNSLLFCNMLIVAQLANIKHTKVINQFGKLNSFSKAQADILHQQVNEYHQGLSQAIQLTQLANSFIAVMSVFDQSYNKLEMLQSIVDILKKELNIHQKRLSKNINIIVFVFLIMLVILLFVSLMLPRITSLVSGLS